MFRLTTAQDLYHQLQSRCTAVFNFEYMGPASTCIDLGKETVHAASFSDK